MLRTKNLKINQISRIISAIVGENSVSTGESVRKTHGEDCSHHSGATPDLVVWPKDVRDVSEIAKFCNSERLPIIPYGTGTGLEGGLTASKGGICMNLQKLDQVLDYNPEDFDVKVQAGVTRHALNHYIRNEGLWFPIDPGADASLGGMCATGASGTNAVRYGTMKENTLNLEVVLADGTIVETSGKGMRAKKTSAGYDLTHLMIGSEGSLGIITNATFKLHARPEKQMAAMAAFGSVQDAINSVVGILQASIPVARIEFLDKLSIKICNQYSKTNYKETPTLFMEFHGSEKSVEEQIDIVSQITLANQTLEFKEAESEEDRRKLWKARHDMHWALKGEKSGTCSIAYKPGLKPLSTDVCIPISKLPELITFNEQYFKYLGMEAPTMGHVGDGNLHTNIYVDPNAKHVENYGFHHDIAAKRIALHAISMGGTCTGEHGIGIGKKKLLKTQFGNEGINMMRTIKDALDPFNIMNPGTVIN